jgi:pimeloyl-ACP methyl ester carboxylesterase
MRLFHKEFGEGKPLIILHGLFGFSDNWQSQAKILSSYFRVVLLDLRNHGRSSWSNTHSYKEMVSDVIETMKLLNIERAHFIGHSMGGKVLMHLAQNHESYIEKMVIVDIGVKRYPMHHQKLIEAVHCISLEGVRARSEVNEMLKPMISNKVLRQFLLKNLYWVEKGVLAWRMNMKVLEESMNDILSSLPSKETLTPCLFIQGGLSDYILEDDLADIEITFPDLEIVTVEKAGHWVHSEAPEEFIQTVLTYVLR